MLKSTTINFIVVVNEITNHRSALQQLRSGIEFND